MSFDTWFESSGILTSVFEVDNMRRAYIAGSQANTGTKMAVFEARITELEQENAELKSQQGVTDKRVVISREMAELIHQYAINSGMGQGSLTWDAKTWRQIAEHLRAALTSDEDENQ